MEMERLDTASYMGTGKHSRWLTGDSLDTCLTRRIAPLQGPPPCWLFRTLHTWQSPQHCYRALPATRRNDIMGRCQHRLCNKIQQCCNSARRPVPVQASRIHKPTRRRDSPTPCQHSPHAHAQSGHNTPEQFQVDTKQMACQQGRHQSIGGTASPTTHQHASPVHDSL